MEKDSVVCSSCVASRVEVLLAQKLINLTQQLLRSWESAKSGPHASLKYYKSWRHLVTRA